MRELDDQVVDGSHLFQVRGHLVPVSGVEIHDLDVSGDVDLTVFAGASSSLVGQDDLDEVGVALEPGSAAGVLVYENAWAAPFATALRKGGGQLVAGGRIPIPAIIAALDAAESA
nr:DUF6325 family protein [Cellulomonas uda]